MRKQLLNIRIKRRIVSAVLVSCMLAGLAGMSDIKVAFASSAEEIRDKAKDDLNQTNKAIDKIKGQQGEVEDELDVAAAQLNVLLSKQQKLKGQIEDTQKQVDQANKDLEAATKKADEEYESMKLRIQFMYENSADNSIWSAILQSNGISDMLNRIEYISSMYKSDRELLAKYQDVVQEVQDLREALTAKMDELLAMQEDYEKQQGEVETLIAALNEKKENYAAQLAQAEEQKAEYEKTIEEQGRIIQEQEEKARREELLRIAKAAADAAAKKAAEKAADDGSSSYEGGGSGASGKSDDVADSGQDPAFSGNVSGDELVAYAKQFVGNPYKWGGNSLTNGCDCSGFVHLIYAHFGYNLPRYSQSFKTVGKAVSYDSIKAGDIIVYPGHVAIAMGNGCIIEAQSTRAGITCNRAVNCHTILAIRRVL